MLVDSGFIDLSKSYSVKYCVPNEIVTTAVLAMSRSTPSAHDILVKALKEARDQIISLCVRFDVPIPNETIERYDDLIKRYDFSAAAAGPPLDCAELFNFPKLTRDYKLLEIDNFLKCSKYDEIDKTHELYYCNTERRGLILVTCEEIRNERKYNAYPKWATHIAIGKRHVN